MRVEYDHHTCGVFAETVWHRLIANVGLELVDPEVDDPHAGEHAFFVARKSA